MDEFISAMRLVNSDLYFEVSGKGCVVYDVDDEGYREAFVLVESGLNGWRVWYVPSKDEVGSIGVRRLLRIGLDLDGVVSYVSRVWVWLFDPDFDDGERLRFAYKVGLMG